MEAQSLLTFKSHKYWSRSFFIFDVASHKWARDKRFSGELLQESHVYRAGERTKLESESKTCYILPFNLLRALMLRFKFLFFIFIFKFTFFYLSLSLGCVQTCVSGCVTLSLPHSFRSRKKVIERVCGGAKTKIRRGAQVKRLDIALNSRWNTFVTLLLASR